MFGNVSAVFAVSYENGTNSVLEANNVIPVYLRVVFKDPLDKSFDINNFNYKDKNTIGISATNSKISLGKYLFVGSDDRVFGRLKGSEEREAEKLNDEIQLYLNKDSENFYKGVILKVYPENDDAAIDFNANDFEFTYNVKGKEIVGGVELPVKVEEIQNFSGKNLNESNSLFGKKVRVIDKYISSEKYLRGLFSKQKDEGGKQYYRNQINKLRDFTNRIMKSEIVDEEKVSKMEMKFDRIKFQSEKEGVNLKLLIPSLLREFRRLQ